jgi:hypothetical protein
MLLLFFQYRSIGSFLLLLLLFIYSNKPVFGALFHLMALGDRLTCLVDEPTVRLYYGIFGVFL